MARPEELRRIEDEGLVVFRYAAAQGVVDDGHNPNGATDNIAGLRNARGNVVGLMPHPEHAVDPDVGPTGRPGRCSRRCWPRRWPERARERGAAERGAAAPAARA